MRKLATLALLALSLLTVACTESEDADTDFEAASIDDVEGLAVDGETDTLSERGASAAQPAADRVTEGSTRPAHAPTGEPQSDRLGATGLATTAPGQPSTGTAECVTASIKLGNGEPVIDTVSQNPGALARARYEAAARVAKR